MVVNFTETDEIFINLDAKSRDNWLSYWIGRLLLSVGPSEVYGKGGGGELFDVPSSFPEIAKASRKCKTFTITKIPRLMLF